MIIILEGPDGAGKTTLRQALVTRLSKRFTVGVAHHGSYSTLENPSLRYLMSLRHRDSPRVVRILDRSWLSEPIYGQALRGGTDRVGVASRRMLERVALRQGALVVLCYPPWDQVRACWAGRRAQELVPDDTKLRAVYDAYHPALFRDNTDLAVFTYDYTTCLANDLLEDLEDRVTIGTDHVPPSSVPGIGVWSPNVTLMVGDRVSSAGWPELPFVSFNHQGCSAWLAWQLHGWGVRETRLYWVNSHGTDPGFMADDHAPRRVVALGRQAEVWCGQAGLGATYVPHPNAHKRFNYSQEYTALKEALT